MNSGLTSQRAYDVLKERILAGAFLPGQRLEPADLGAMLDMSITPVRDALHVLAGEALVEARTSNGFHLPMPTEGWLRDLYAWNAQVLLAAIADWPRTDAESDIFAPRATSRSVSTDTALLFDAIALHSTNKEHGRVIRSIGERLHAARRAEPSVVSDMEAELRTLIATTNSSDRAALRLLVNAYHRRRTRVTASLIDAIASMRTADDPDHPYK